MIKRANRSASSISGVSFGYVYCFLRCFFCFQYYDQVFPSKRGVSLLPQKRRRPACKEKRRRAFRYEYFPGKPLFYAHSLSVTDHLLYPFWFFFISDGISVAHLKQKYLAHDCRSAQRKKSREKHKNSRQIALPRTLS